MEAGDVFRDQIIADFKYLDSGIKAGLKIDPKLNYSMFLLDCYSRLSFSVEIDLSLHIVSAQQELDNQSKSDFITRLWAYTVLELCGVTPLRSSLDNIISESSNRVTTQSDFSHLGQSIAATSYYVIDIYRTPSLHEVSQLEITARHGIAWLLSMQKGGFWRSERGLYGGNLGPNYTTALALRALILYLTRKSGRYLASVFHPSWENTRRRKKVSSSATEIFSLTKVA